MAIYNVQIYNSFEFIYSKHESIPEILRKIVLWDETFTIPQYRPIDSVSAIEYLYQDYDDEELKSNLGWSVGDAIAFLRKLSNIGFNKRGPFCIDIRTLSGTNGLTPEIIGKLDSIFSHESSDVNAEYLDPANN